MKKETQKKQIIKPAVKRKFSLVMVAYNEATHIKRVIKEYYEEVFTKLPKGSEFIVYLDGSTDKTPQIVKSLEKECGLRIIDCKQNKGYFGAAKSALSYAKHDVFFSDSSGKHHAADFWKMISLFDDCDIVNGLRSDRTDTAYRQILSICQRLFVSALFFVPLYDHNTGYKLIKKDVLRSVLDECTILPITFSVELIVRAIKKGYKIIEVPVSFTKREGKEKQFSLAKLPKALIRSIKGYMRLWWAINFTERGKQK